jgi:hypothetical protein
MRKNLSYLASVFIIFYLGATIGLLSKDWLERGLGYLFCALGGFGFVDCIKKWKSNLRS